MQELHFIIKKYIQMVYNILKLTGQNWLNAVENECGGK
jgi:hypothetical protein